MTSVYEDKIYPQIPATAPSDDEGQAYRLKKIGELEKFLRTEVDSRDAIGKKFKRRGTTVSFSSMIVTTTITGLEISSVIALSTGVGAPISLALAAIGLGLGVSSMALRKGGKILNEKRKKHEKVKVLAESKLDSISSLVSRAVNDAVISHEEYQLILKEVDSYRRMKTEIRTKSKKTTDAISAEQREEILKIGREEGKQDFLQKIAASSDTQPVNAT